MKIGLISTLNTNIGDDFIRLGIQRILKKVYGQGQIDWVVLNKHQPQTVWPAWHPIRLLPEWAPNWRKVGRRLGMSIFHSCDIVVQCGAPVVWDNCSACEWNEPVWQEVIKGICQKVPVLNLSAGSAFPLSRLPVAVERESDREYLKSIMSYCRLTTARDRLTSALMKEIEPDVAVSTLPCTAGLVSVPDVCASGREVVAVNYMPKAGHFDFRKDVNESEWESVFRKVIDKLSRKQSIIFLCHSQQEVEISESLFPAYPRVLPGTIEQYEGIAKRCIGGVFNRLHAAVAYAGMGVPSVAVGNDSRLLMLEEYGLPAFDVRSCQSEQILDAFYRLVDKRSQQVEKLTAIYENNLSHYADLISSHL